MFIYTNLVLIWKLEYLDHQDQDKTCESCKAKLWYGEAIRSGKDKKSFSMCCGNYKVVLPPYKEPPTSYVELFLGLDNKSKYFLSNTRRLNSMFSFTSMGGKIDKSINKGKGPNIFRLSGQNYHLIGSLLPEHGSTPKFAQLYIYDTENEVSNRKGVFRYVGKWTLFFIFHFLIIFFDYMIYKY